MTVCSLRQRYKTGFFRAGLWAMLLCGGASLAFAQGAPQAEAPAEQLPPDFAQDQIPPAFPTMIDQQPASAAPAAQPQQAATAAEAQTAPQGEPATPAEGGAAQPAAANVPAQPEAKQLVPATAMGADAQQNVEGAEQPPQQDRTPVPLEEPATAEAAAEEAPAMPDILEKYTAEAEAAAEEDANMQGTDALPNVQSQEPPTVGSLKIEGKGFDIGNNTADVPIDGALSEAGNKRLQEEIRSEAYDAAITGMFPLAPDQVQGLLKRYDQTQEAAKTPPYDAPKPEISVQNISLDPGVSPPVIKTAVGNVTTLNILDATGAPWPVQDVTWAGDYEVVEPEQGGHIIRITPMSHFARGNIVVRMLTLKTPLTLTLETGRDVVQYRVDARIPEYGPFASTPILQGGKSLVAGTPELTSILDGVAPGGAVKLTVSGVDGRTTAYLLGGTTYVRTPLTLLSPAWSSSVSSADGMNVYALSNAPVLLLSDGGEFMRAMLKEKEDLLDE